MDTTTAPTDSWSDFILHRRKREDLDLTQEDIAAALGVRQSAVSRWERGDYLPPTSHIGALVDVLKITPDELSALLRNTRESAA